MVHLTCVRPQASGASWEGFVCPDPLAMRRKVAVELDRASLREHWQM